MELSGSYDSMSLVNDMPNHRADADFSEPKETVSGTILRRVAGQLVPRLPFPSPLIAPDRAIDHAHLKK